MTKAKLNLSLSSALISALTGVLSIPAGASAASVSATPAIPWPGASVRLQASGFEPRARGVATLTGAKSVRFRVDSRGRATVVLLVPGTARPGRHLLRIQAGDRAVSTALFFVGARRASSTMVALSAGQRVLLDPASGHAGDRFALKVTGFSRRTALEVRFGGATVARKRPSSAGNVTIAGAVPAIATGRRVVRVVSGRTAVALGFLVLRPSPAADVVPPPWPPPPPAVLPPPPDTTSPAVSVTEPASGAALGAASVAVAAAASDNVGVSGVQFRLDGNALGAEDTSAPYATTWNTTNTSPGSHTLTAVARDAAGNTATSSAVAVTVDKAPPVTSVTAPADGATLSGTIAVTAAASDNVGVSAVQFRLDGTAFGAEDTSAPYATTWNTTNTSPGSHTLTAVARDAAGNTATSSAVSVTVNNSGSRKIAAAGDIACSPNDPDFNGGLGTTSHCRQKATSDLLLGKGYSDVLTLGDTQYDCATAADFAGSFHPTWGRLKNIIHPAAGNHEYKSTNPDDYGVSGCRPDAEGYFGYFGPAAGDPSRGYYSFEIGSWHVVSLNTNLASATGCPVISCALDSAQERWLRADLAAHSTRCTLAIWHHPLFSSKTPSTASRPFWDDLYAAGAEIVLNGHVHNYERFNPQRPDGTADPAGVAQFVVGTGGLSLESTGSPVRNSAAATATFGVLELTLNPASYDWKFLTAAGQTPFDDAGSANCH